MNLPYTLWAFLTATLCLVAPSLGEVQPHYLSSHSEVPRNDYMSSSNTEYVPDVFNLMKKLALLQQYPGKFRNEKNENDVRQLSHPQLSRSLEEEQILEKRKFPEVDSRGFDEDIFDEGFGDWSPMKRW